MCIFKVFDNGKYEIKWEQEHGGSLSELGGYKDEGIDTLPHMGYKKGYNKNCDVISNGENSSGYGGMTMD